MRQYGQRNVGLSLRWVPKITCSKESSELAPWFTGKGILPSVTEKPGRSTFSADFLAAVLTQPKEFSIFRIPPPLPQRLVSSNPLERRFECSLIPTRGNSNPQATGPRNTSPMGSPSQKGVGHTSWEGSQSKRQTQPLRYWEGGAKKGSFGLHCPSVTADWPQVSLALICL